MAKNILIWWKIKNIYFSHKSGRQWPVMHKLKPMIFFQTRYDFLDNFLLLGSLCLDEVSYKLRPFCWLLVFYKTTALKQMRSIFHLRNICKLQEANFSNRPGTYVFDLKGSRILNLWIFFAKSFLFFTYFVKMINSYRYNFWSQWILPCCKRK